MIKRVSISYGGNLRRLMNSGDYVPTHGLLAAFQFGADLWMRGWTNQPQDRYTGTPAECLFDFRTDENERILNAFENPKGRVTITHSIKGNPSQQTEEHLVMVRCFNHASKEPALSLLVWFRRDGEIAGIDLS